MKKFKDIWYEERTCPLAVRIERTINSCGSIDKHLNDIEEFMTKPDLWRFMLGCMLYWAEAEHWDDGNRYAVFASKQIIRQFPKLSKIEIPDSMLRESYGFTLGAHRYIQNELFKTTQEFMRRYDSIGIQSWFEDQQFVYNDTNDGLIPYETYKIRKMMGIS